MTTTGASGGRPEAQPGGTDGALTEPVAATGQSGDSGGSPPTAPAQPPRQAADEGDEPRESFGSIVAETLGLAPGSSRRRRVVTLLVMMAIAFVAVFRDTLIDYVMIKSSVAKENESNTQYDANKVPFTVSVQPEEDEPLEWAMVLDRKLTPDETRELVARNNDRSGAFSYLKELGARPLVHTATMEYAPERYKQQMLSSNSGTFADVFRMHIMSTRSSAVVINGWKVTDITCRKSIAQTIVEVPPQGGGVYEGLQLHIPPLAGEPVLADDIEGQGEPYFSTRYVEVGGGQSSSGFKVQAIGPSGQSCEWGIKVRYTDSYQNTRWVQLKDKKGKTLRIRTESPPLDATQRWVFIVDPWRLCDLTPETLMPGKEKCVQ
ncbi:hypothetical protein [Streptomyces sp. NL15-2K]|uniref:hypothetical protein n=1 Tax=Streptomyces sp. NL15-2K TaxID=376149 RepID=UPI000F55E99E|nr:MULTISPECIES: hypothetical protein [Actinomycetes]WKX15924.1 hypothetical protein Q4V64_53960 [Kutzneria buriramensis]GCB53135.1 hypothetical protein SNL152K_10492 [Streptomyces sp. NL15-2K]